MLFNSPEFIFVFLPLAVTLHFWLARRSVEAAIAATTLSSLGFYAWWNPPYVLLLAGSILANYWLARRMAAAGPAAARSWFIAGIAANLLVLGYYKYADFLLSIVAGSKAAPANVPLGLSFITFVQIAFLADVHQRRIPLEFRRYGLFVAFFPHLIAGPIVRWRNLGRQILDPARYRLDWDNVALGLTIFTLGLVKKVLIADTLAPHVNTVFDAAARGDPITALAAWGACLAFTAQIFFDFSGYSDMAVGLGLLFNFRLPINFAAPLRATSMVDLWRRWHVTLSQFFRDLVYAPLTQGRRAPLRQSISAVFTMTLVGLWHGAGWTFIAWGAYQGVLLVINVAWQQLRPGSDHPTRSGSLAGWALTFTAFAVGAVFFRAADLAAAGHMFTAMAGFGGAPVAESLTLTFDHWGIKNGYISEAFVRIWFGTTWSMVGTLTTLAALAVALLVPDTFEITRYRDGEVQSDWRRPVGILAWRPSPLALAATTILFAAVFFQLNRVSEFIYFQF
jgi:D-alanyl-lipoteichoic acid acyltransferase DltB (MBOAT superfamily)